MSSPSARAATHEIKKYSAIVSKYTIFWCPIIIFVVPKKLIIGTKLLFYWCPKNRYLGAHYFIDAAHKIDFLGPVPLFWGLLLYFGCTKQLFVGSQLIFFGPNLL